ncbi:MAG: hypothetical protein QW227_01655 [Candidatus Aenigmatarchaeota archaeon]
MQKSDYTAFEKFIENEKKKFIFGVDYFNESECSILIDQRIPIDITSRIPDTYFVAICPDNKRAGRTESPAERRLIFYITTKQFRQFMKEARAIGKKYTKGKGLETFAFYRIPDAWYANTALVKFLNQKVMSHPKFKSIAKTFTHLVFGT